MYFTLYEINIIKFKRNKFLSNRIYHISKDLISYNHYIGLEEKSSRQLLNCKIPLKMKYRCFVGSSIFEVSKEAWLILINCRYSTKLFNTSELWHRKPLQLDVKKNVYNLKSKNYHLHDLRKQEDHAVTEI